MPIGIVLVLLMSVPYQAWSKWQSCRLIFLICVKDAMVFLPEGAGQQPNTAGRHDGTAGINGGMLHLPA